MSDQSLKDILAAERAASERIAAAKAEAEKIRADAAGKVAAIDADASARIETARRQSQEKLANDIVSARDAGLAGTTAAVSALEKRFTGKKEDIISTLSSIVTGKETP